MLPVLRRILPQHRNERLAHLIAAAIRDAMPTGAPPQVVIIEKLVINAASSQGGGAVTNLEVKL